MVLKDIYPDQETARQAALSALKKQVRQRIRLYLSLPPPSGRAVSETGPLAEKAVTLSEFPEGGLINRKSIIKEARYFFDTDDGLRTELICLLPGP